MKRRHTETISRRNRPPDRQRFAWIGVPIRIALEGDRLTDFQGQIIGFDRSWVRVRFEGKKPRLREGTGVGVQLPPTGREVTLPLQGIVWRLEPEGVMTVLLSLSTQEFQRLRSLAARVAQERMEPLKRPSPRSWLDWRQPAGVDSPWARPAPPEGAPNPSPETPEDAVEARGWPHSASPAETVDASTEPVSTPPAPDEFANTEPVGPPSAGSQPAPVQHAVTWVREEDYKTAARFFFEGLRAEPVDLSLWCSLGATMYHLGKKRAAADVLQHVVQHGRLDSREVRLARSWLERLGAVEVEERRRPEPDAASHAPPRAENVEPTSAPERPRPAEETREDPAPRTEARSPEVRPKPPGRVEVLQDEFGYFEAAPQSSQPGLPAAPPQPRARRPSPPEAAEGRAKPAPRAPVPQREGGRVSPATRRGQAGPGPAEQAALLAAQGNYAEAARRYAEALRASPENGSLWYALGVTLRHLNRPQEAAEALQQVIRHGEPESLVRLARLWLERGGVGAEPLSASRPSPSRPSRRR